MAADLKVVTGEVRLSYVNLLRPRSPGLDNAGNPLPPKYSCVLLIPKNTADGKRTYKAIQAAQKEALEAGKAKFGGKIPPNWRNTLHDGDTDADLEKSPEYAGMWYISVSANEQYPPNVVDRRLQKIIDATEIYSGVWARVSMIAFAFNTQGNKGVSFGLRNVQKTRDDEPFGGVSRAEDDFDSLDDDTEAGDDLI